MGLKELLLGRRLTSSEQNTRRIGWFEAVPAMGLDGLGSSSYGPEAALAVMIPIGAAGLAWVGPLMAAIVVLLAILYLSYRQTVVAYPEEAGAYTVAKENLGCTASLLAAAALMIDFVLNVAVGISAGVGALVSVVPSLQPHILPVCLGILALITVANLRGTPEAGWLFSIPTYLFLVSFLGLMAYGLTRLAANGWQAQPVVAPPPVAVGTEAVGAWLLMRAFASGCTAMTGVEAVSNSISAFKKPVVEQAHRTLTVICLALGLLLAGIAVLAKAYGVGAMDQTQTGYQSVLSQLVAALVGRGWIYDVALGSVLAVLCLSANTSFVAFPRLCRSLAEDGFLPRPFAVSDRRLVFSVGIGALAGCAALLLVAFGGITDRLIPLFAIGAFLTFTLSQAGMVSHWRRQGGNRTRLMLNALGAAATAVALVIIVMAKFAEGAWVTVVAVPLVIALLRAIRRYYDRLDERLAVKGPFDLDETEPPSLIVALEGRTRMSDRALQFAVTLSPDVYAVHLLKLDGPEEQDDGAELRASWDREVSKPLRRRGVKPPNLVLLPAPYREIHEPLLTFMDRLDQDTPGRSVAVLIPELVLGHWWERVLHNRRGDRLRRMLLKHGGPRLNVIITPWRL